MRIRAFLLSSILIAAVPIALFPAPDQGPMPGRIDKGDFALAYDGQGITALAHAKDPYGAQLFSPGGRMVPVIKYRVPGGDWLDAYRGETRLAASPDGTTLTYTDSVAGTVLDTVQTFRTDGRVLDWTIELATRMAIPVTVGDLAVQIPWQFPAGEDPAAIFEKSWTKHHLIAGAGSFLYFVRPNGEPSFLVVTPRPGTSLEFAAAEDRGGFRAFIHSGLTGGAEKRGTWRQAHSTRELGPAGSPDSRMTAGFRFRWARSYGEIRDILYDEGLFDIRVVPGMTVPLDLPAQIALRTKARIESLSPEFPDRTKIVDQGEPRPGGRVFRLEFQRLGENRIKDR